MGQATRPRGCGGRGGGLSIIRWALDLILLLHTARGGLRNADSSRACPGSRTSFGPNWRLGAQGLANRRKANRRHSLGGGPRRRPRRRAHPSGAQDTPATWTPSARP
eukprot:2237858-Pyramimonas_sp.AAC.1